MASPVAASVDPTPVHPTDLGNRLVVAPSQPAAGVILVRLVGELDMEGLPRVHRVLASAIDGVATEATRSRAGTGRPRGRVVCELDGLEFLSLSGVRALLAAARRAEARDVEFVLVASRRPACRVLELSGLGDAFRIVRVIDPSDTVGAARPAAA